ncbi:ribonuclease Z [Clostridium sp. LY3-2]|uniref:ribonuclease Z n=1 Tax=Clostridium sp. LY3-2 TaxID=2942482 RepID=UPI0021527288|nr:ribonuclease Z [Clostridium sp. LY3-2]MCR6513293.1 ribonuclease Z [Clostridium sp. LY3-2]
MLNLTFLGTGGGMPMPYRHLSSSVMKFRGRKILVDCGEGTQIWCREYNVGFKSFDIILITHLHGDHINGLNGMLSTIGNCGREEKIIIIGPFGLKKALEGLLVTASHLPFEIEVIEVKKSNLHFKIKDDSLKPCDKRDSEIDIKTIELEHSIECIGYDFEFIRKRKFDVDKAIKNKVPKALWSKLQKGEDNISLNGEIFTKEMVLGEKRKGIKVSYITDTRPIDSIKDFIVNSDLFICEGTYGDDLDINKAIINKHMTFREGAILAKKAKVKELIFTHFSQALLHPDHYLKNAIEEFENSKLAKDGYEIELNFND